MRFISTDNEVEAADQILKAVTALYNKNQRTEGEPIAFQVLSPRYAGPAGVSDLNDRIRNVLNPNGLEVVKGRNSFRIGDRVMITKNDYKLGVYNGETGKIDHFDTKDKKIIVRIHDEKGDRHIPFPVSRFSSLVTLAYAVTIHRYQGQEVDVIFLPMCLSFGYQLERHMIYTALTRARKRALIFGSWSAIMKSVRTNKVIRRHGHLATRLQRGLSQGS